MITIQNIYSDTLGNGGNDGSVVTGQINSKVTCMLYIDYEKGSEDSVTLTFDAFISQLNDYYPIMYENTTTTVAPIKKVLSESGNYRLVVAIAENETGMRINAYFNNVGSNPGTVVVTVAPASPLL